MQEKNNNYDFLKSLSFIVPMVAIVISATWFLASENSKRALSIQTSKVEVRLLKESINRSIATNEKLLNKLQRMESYIVSIDYQLKAVCQEVTNLRKELDVSPSTSVCNNYNIGPHTPLDPTRFPQKSPEHLLAPAIYNKSDKRSLITRTPYTFS
jgi:hypothetical protein